MDEIYRDEQRHRWVYIMEPLSAVQETWPVSRGLEPVVHGAALLDEGHLSVIGWQDAEAVRLAERARYR